MTKKKEKQTKPLSDEPTGVPKGSFLDGILPVAGSVGGPSDLATNSARMKDFGRQRATALNDIDGTRPRSK